MGRCPPLGGAKGCAKPGCSWPGVPLNRHHKRHQALWLNVWAWRGAEPRWRAFVRRYHEFRKEDVCTVCMNHHAEIHIVYDRIIAGDLVKTGKKLSEYSWKQAQILMDKLEAACNKWLLTDTPGFDSKLYNSLKSMIRGIEKTHVKRRRRRAR